MKRLLFLLFLVLGITINAQNKVRNGNFEKGLSTWQFSVVDETNATAEEPFANADFSEISPGLANSKKALFVNIVEHGKFDWYISATNRIIAEKNNFYNLSFNAKSSESRNISIGIFNENGNELVYLDTVAISTEEKSYGPFKFHFTQAPSNPRIKILFGGEKGNVTLDEIFLEIAPIEIISSNTLEDVIGDITLPHEGLPHGVWDKYDWGKKPREGAKAPPDHWTAAIAWGQLYEWVDGNPAKNTRVQIRDLAMYYLSKTDSLWHELQNSVLVEGAAYVEDFVGDVNKPADKRNEPDGSISVTAGDGYNFHFWPSTGRVEIPKGDVIGCFVTVNARLILDDPNGVDDRDSARYLMGVGGDWWESLSAVWDNWTTNWDMGIGRFRFVKKEWHGFNLITLSPEQTRKFPPPLPLATSLEKKIKIDANDSNELRNYPNPFKRNTTIEYVLKKPSRVKLEIFDLGGTCIKKLVDNFQMAQSYTIDFDGSELKTGIYYCKLTTGNFTETQKLMLLK